MRRLSQIRRLAGKSPGYIVRRAWLEAIRLARTGWMQARICTLTPEKLASETGHPSLSSFWSTLRAAGFLFTEADRALLRELYGTSYAAEGVRIRERAEKIIAHEFDLLGSGLVQLGPEIDWHRDFKTGRRWNLEPARKIDYAELDRPSDVKVAWELSRGHHLVTLGQAWIIGQDTRMVREFESQVDSWIRANPIGYGVNWACTMEVGLRAVNWIWALAMFGDAPLSSDFVHDILLALYRHGLWIPENLEIAHVNGNHYIADVLGMVACGTLFQSTPEGKRWLRKGAKILQDEIHRQVEADGVGIEASIPYHRLVLEIFLTGGRLMEEAKLSVPGSYWDKIAGMIDFVHGYTPPNGLSPVIGDADDGRVLRFSDTPIRDHRYLLSTGCALFTRPDWKERAAKYWEESLWFAKPSRRSIFETLQAVDSEASSAYPIAGFYILRSPAHYLFVDAGPVGFRGLGGHGHNDCLSFEWHFAGYPLITDSGLYVYTASPEWRNLSRSTAFHNTIRVDGSEINQFLTPPTLWFLGNDAQPTGVELRKEGNRTVLTAGHIGYRRLADPVTVHRSFAIDRNCPDLQICDQLQGKAEHEVEFFFHAAPGATACMLDQGGVEFAWAGGYGARIWADKGSILQWELQDGWFFPSYGIRIIRPVCRVTLKHRLPVVINWNLSASRY